MSCHFKVTCYLFTILPLHLFILVFIFPSSSLHQLEQLSHLQQSPFPLQFPLLDEVIATDAMPTHWAFYFQGIWFTFIRLVDAGQVLCVGLILPCRSFRPCCQDAVQDGLPAYLVRWLPCIWITALLRLICVIMVVQCLLFFPG